MNKNIENIDRILVPDFTTRTTPYSKEEIEEQEKTKAILAENHMRDWLESIRKEEERLIKILTEDKNV